MINLQNKKKFIIKLSLGIIFIIGLTYSYVLFKDEDISQESPNALKTKLINNNAPLYIPVSLAFMNGNLLIADFHGERLIKEIDINNPEHFYSFAQRGSGPSEFLGPLMLWEYKDRLYTADRRKFKLGYFNFIKGNKELPYNYNELFNYPNTISRMINICDTLYLASGYFEKGRYAIVNEKGEIVKYVGTYPDFLSGEASIPYDAKAMFHQIQFTPNYSLKKIAALSSHVLDIIDIDQQIRTLNRIQLDDYDYEFTSGSIVQTHLKDEFNFGAYSITSTDDFIFILCSPYNKSNKMHNNREILVYDWNGILQKKYEVSFKLTKIKSIDNTLMIGINEDVQLLTIEFDHNEAKY